MASLTRIAGAELRAEIRARARAGVELDHIESSLIEPAPVPADEKAALWLLAWGTRERGAERCRS